MGCGKQIKTQIHGTRHEAKDEAKRQTSHKANIKDAQYTIQPARGGDKQLKDSIGNLPTKTDEQLLDQKQSYVENLVNTEDA